MPLAKSLVLKRMDLAGIPSLLFTLGLRARHEKLLCLGFPIDEVRMLTTASPDVTTSEGGQQAV